jgi:hypothetical protein
VFRLLIRNGDFELGQQSKRGANLTVDHEPSLTVAASALNIAFAWTHNGPDSLPDYTEMVKPAVRKSSIN